MNPKWLTVGKIVNTHGIRGELKILSQTHFPEERFKKGAVLTFIHPETAEAVEAKVTSARVHKNSYIVKFASLDDINEAEKYKGWLVKVSEEERIELPEDEYYYYEIIGCEVVTTEGASLGTVTEILSPGANDVWVVTPAKGKPVYIPYIEDVVKQVDVGSKRITIELMDGLI